jgi:hypothetical protein
MVLFSMAMDLDALKFLLHLKLDLQGKNVLTVGHMEWYAGQIGKLILAKKLDKTIEPTQYSDFVFSELGAASVHSIDYSGYEGATIVFDLNERIPQDYVEKYDLLFDSGSLEHIYDCQQAIHNYMRLCKTGGSLVLVLPTNNQMGHGFYQFSPEFFFRTLSRNNGFHLKEMLLRTGSGFGRWYNLKDPKLLGARQEIKTLRRSMLLVHAIKTSETPELSNLIQSDYEAVKNGVILSKWGNRYLKSPSIVQFWIKHLVLKPRDLMRSRLRMKRIRIKY